MLSGVWTWLYCPESGNRTFEENQEFFWEAAEKGSWSVHRVKGGRWRRLPDYDENGEEQGGDEGGEESGNGKGKGKKNGDGQGEQEPLLGRRDDD